MVSCPLGHSPQAMPFPVTVSADPGPDSADAAYPGAPAHSLAFAWPTERQEVLDQPRASSAWSPKMPASSWGFSFPLGLVHLLQCHGFIFRVPGSLQGVRLVETRSGLPWAFPSDTCLFRLQPLGQEPQGRDTKHRVSASQS